MNIDGSVVIVTGSATGIGAASALKLAREGAKVVVNYSRSSDEAEATADEIRKSGGEVIVLQANVGEDADCRRLAQQTLDKWGRIDGLVNNAGTTKFADHDDLEALDVDDFLSIYKVNVVGAFQMIRACRPAMKEQGYGSVVNISSIAGVKAIGSSVAYAASKGALNNMTMSLARALAPEVRINAVCPGFVGTRWFRDRLGEEGFAKMVGNVENSTPLQHAGTPEDIAEAVAWFIGPGGRNTTGETLLVDAGAHLAMALRVRRKQEE